MEEQRKIRATGETTMQRSFVVPPLPGFLAPPPRTAGKSSSFSPKLAYILLIVFIIVVFLVSFIYFYMRRSSTNPAAVGNIQGQAPVTSRRITVVVVVTEAAGESSICLEGVAEGEDVKMTAHCRHIFHANCIATWLENHVTCPVCRYSEMGGEKEVKKKKMQQSSRE
ncbi:hypothetical protein PHAVU_011G170500 [Phaseolus vulgaris]|uniref:RING-type E3 ubiquitin transferase n=1 Tax=Phaseolus vulgaris TaxID=3885 RepID=V7AIF4_PHAVU|nr:hypothetical protein PHAVU_011G170500g [Phaseolus vulgaris]ESW05324.1 hypothetical protein PHAVU_011G170500g [Phaseolus vulgaris]